MPDQLVEVGGRQLKVSNLDKVLYPATGFTKAEVIDYYVRVAPVMVPHIADRGVTLRRYPNGVDETSFFEKRCPSHRPEWIGTFAGPGDRNGTIGYCALDSVAALAWSANMAALEIHAPMARGADIESPTMCVFDLDPGPGPASPSAPRWPSTSATCSTTWPGSSASPRPPGRRACRSTCRSTPRTPTSTARSSPKPSPRCSRSTTASGSPR